MDQDDNQSETKAYGVSGVRDTFRELLSPQSSLQGDDTYSANYSFDSSHDDTIIYVRKSKMHNQSKFSILEPSDETIKEEQKEESERLREDEFLYSKIRHSQTPYVSLPPSKNERLFVFKESIVDNPVSALEEIARSKNEEVLWYSPAYIIASIRYNVSRWANSIIQHPLFDTVILLTILANSVVIAIDDPTDSQTQNWAETVEFTFQSIYTLEVLLKVCGMGLLMREGAYLRDPWNILDCTIVFFGWLSELNFSAGIDLKTLRMFRILRPLRTITSLEGLKLLMVALFTSIPLLFDILIILMFFFILFSIAGVQLWHGVLYKRCLHEETGEILTNQFCGEEPCPSGYICVKYISNPNYGVTNFDDIFNALLTIFQSVTLQGWTDNQLAIVQTSGYYALIYFIILTMIGGFFIVNFSLAVITSRVTQLVKEMRQAATAKSKVELIQKQKTVREHNKNEVKKFIGLGALSIISRKFDLTKFNNSVEEPKEEKKSVLLKSQINQIDEILEDSMDDIEEDRQFDERKMLEESQEEEDYHIFQFEKGINKAGLKSHTASTTKNTTARKQLFGSITASFLGGLNIEALQKEENFEGKTKEVMKEIDDNRVALSRQFAQSINIPVTKKEEISFSQVSEVDPDKLSVFILREAPIEIESAADVLYFHFRKDLDLNPNPLPLLPPYKIAIRYEPNHSTAEEDPLLKSEIEEPLIENLEPKLEEGNPDESRLSIPRFGTENDKPDDSHRSEDPRSEQSVVFAKTPIRRQLTKQGSKRLQQVQKAKAEFNIKRIREHEKKLKQLGMHSTKHHPDFPSGNSPRNEPEITPVQKLIQSVRVIEVKDNDPFGPESQSVTEVLSDLKFEDSISSKPIVKWNGEDVLPRIESAKSYWITTYLNEIKIYPFGISGFYKCIQFNIRRLVKSVIFDNVMLLLVVANTILLSFQRYGQSNEEEYNMQIANMIFTSFYCAELGLKVFSLGIVGYLMDPFNYLDCGIVIFSLAEIIFLDGSGTFSAFLALRVFKVIRILRSLRVLRVARLLKSFRSMQLIIEVIGNTITSFGYISMLTGVFILIFSLLGMQLFGGRFDFPEGVPRQNFDSFHNALLCVYQILTLEDWHLLLYNGMRCQNAIITVLYFVSWIFLGNYVLMNLFLAIMFDAFSHFDQEINSEDYSIKSQLQRIPTIKVKPKKETKKKKKQDKKKVQKLRLKRLGTKMAEKKKLLDIDIRDDDTKKKKKSPLHDAVSEYSLFLFSKENKFRVICWKIASSNILEIIVIVLIVLSSILLAVETYYLEDPDSSEENVSYFLNLFFTIAFCVEALIKAVSYGFVFEPQSYLRDVWNQLDFFIIVCALLDLAIPQFNLQIIRIFRLLRTLRPLRFLTHNNEMRILVSTLFKSLTHIMNIIIVVLIIFIMFSIVGVSFFAGKFQYCTIDKFENSSREQCQMNGGLWKTYDLNFDNVLNGLVTLFVLTTLESWPEVLQHGTDTTEVDQGPKKNESWYYAYFFVVFISVSSMFLMNLFVGTLFLRFSKERQYHDGKKSSAILLAEEQVNWIEVQRMIIRARPNYEARTIPTHSPCRKVFHSFVTSLPFDIIMTIVIILNLVHMSLLYDSASDTYIAVLNFLNYIFAGIFSWEVTLKMIAYGIDFWFDSWNILGLIIVLSVYVDIVFTQIYTINVLLIRIVPPLVRVLRVLRVSRLLRLMRKYKRMQELMEIIALCLPSMMNVFALLTLILFIYSVLGCYLFYDITEGEAITHMYNFRNFGNSMLLCIKISTGENWDTFMFDFARINEDCVIGPTCGNLMAFFYFLSFKLIVTYIMINFFIVAVLGLFDMYFVEANSLVFKYKEDYEIFQEVWHKVGPTHRGFMIQNDKLIKFFEQLPDPLGMGEIDRNTLSKNIVDMQIQSDKNGNVFYNELLFCVIKRARASNLKLNKLLVKQEKRTRRKIQQTAESLSLGVQYEFERKEFVMGHSNPFVALMIMRLTLKIWRRYKNDTLIKQEAMMRRKSTRGYRTQHMVNTAFGRNKTLARPFKISQVVPIERTNILHDD